LRSPSAGPPNGKTTARLPVTDLSTRSSAYTSAMFSETRYALNGDLRVAYRASAEGERDIVFVPNWFTNCEVVPELLPSVQGWTEAMTSLGRVVYFDQPGKWRVGFRIG
jgi:hypothetical protein